MLPKVGVLGRAPGIGDRVRPFHLHVQPFVGMNRSNVRRLRLGGVEPIGDTQQRREPERELLRLRVERGEDQVFGGFDLLAMERDQTREHIALLRRKATNVVRQDHGAPGALVVIVAGTQSDGMQHGGRRQQLATLRRQLVHRLRFVEEGLRQFGDVAWMGQRDPSLPEHGAHRRGAGPAARGPFQGAGGEHLHAFAREGARPVLHLLGA